ncbi:cupredoxin superfamily protein [Actinidia rufa]|uniref:Cupredoxin superfamily protein n=1 Tax=Actinidia rufa TaxID=165716 RepID=A0A7J0E6E8_9ERIC|nr:cupredoxin superfamily protein [Actinidia rufa]
MAKQLLLCVLVIFGLALTSKATMYTVGDNSGWDISTDLDTWAKDKRFVVGDILAFQFSSYHSVNEVAKQSYEGCNTTNVLQSSSNGNTSFPLNTPGDRYFVCGNKLHCLGGMKLHVQVEENQGALSPAGAPESGAALPTSPSSKSGNPSAVVPSSAVLVHGGIRVDSLVLGFVGFVASTMC